MDVLDGGLGMPPFLADAVASKAFGGPAGRIRPLDLRASLVETARFPHVGVVRDYSVLRQIGRIRHEQYVARQAKPYPSIVLDRNCLIELSDFVGINIYARDKQGITCAMRIGSIADGQNPQARLLRQTAEQLGVPLDVSLTCGRLARAPRHSGRHAIDLVRFVRWQTVRAGWRYCLMQTAEKLVPFFTRLEFRETGVWIDDSTAGRLQVLLLDTEMRMTRQGDN
jgi:hypothetical protein